MSSKPSSCHRHRQREFSTLGSELETLKIPIALKTYHPSLYSPIGELICPAYHELCNTAPVAVSGQCPNACNFNGDFVEGRYNYFLDFMVMIVVNIPSPATTMTMASISQMEFVNVKLATLTLTVPSHCAPSEPSILQQLEEVVVMPNYHRPFPGGARKLFNIFGSSYCDEVTK
ncbi:hypothetical protein Ahy_B05g077270 [Arachis hypogaea]|uniref:Uncharacterized protein n=1 Tax=Arachis hypogaea TaxID=3818 RepID=A0A444Z4M1_ARAHY|nr:hypothetical protein Ahy_B05g077270 [Arachis hypogaea]